MKKLIVLSLLFVFTCQFFTHAQWLEKKGDGYFKLSAWTLEADRHYTNTGATDPNATRGTFNLNIYGKYGLSRNWNLIAYIPFYVKTYQNHQVSSVTNETLIEGEENTSFGDMDLGIEYRLLKTSKLAFSAVLTLGIPSGDSNGGSDGSYQTGDGEFNQEIRFNAGTSFKIFKQPFYAKSYVGFNNRTENFSDEIRFGIEAGTNFFNKRVLFLMRSNTVRSLKNGSLSAANSNGSIFANNVEFVSIGWEAAIKFTKNLGISVGSESAFSGRVIYAAPSYSAGVFYLLK
ncbi:MAG: hypothetical protein P8P50_05915 [Flavobacteriaceae bacterium]|jgi:hypothetical protein|nr:hypothetical protein [Flavobacteriaceae bacterium]